MQTLGPDTGWDSIGDIPQAQGLARFLDKLDMDNTTASDFVNKTTTFAFTSWCKNILAEEDKAIGDAEKAAKKS